MKKIISVILILSLFLCIFTSCGSDSNLNNPNPDAILNDILKSYKTNGLTSWWEVVAIYNAGDNPADYKGFEDLYKSLEGETHIKMASYVIVADIAIIKGADSEKFDKYEEYKANLKNLLENPSDKHTLNDYIFGYLALNTSGAAFNDLPVFSHISESQKPDGGFALSGDSGDIDITAFAIPALWRIMRSYQTITFDLEFLKRAVNFLENNINENGTFSSYDNENANSTACVLSALIGYYGHYINVEIPNEIMQKAADGLALFKVYDKDKKQTGYSFLIDGRINTLATAQAAIALGDLKNKTSVWDKLYLDSVAVSGK